MHTYIHTTYMLKHAYIHNAYAPEQRDKIKSNLHATYMRKHAYTHNAYAPEQRDKIKSNLHDRVEALMQMLFDMDMMRKSMLEMEVSILKCVEGIFSQCAYGL